MTESAERPLTHDLVRAARYYLGGRRGPLLLGAVALIAGLALNWNWLVAAGIAPILISVLPCVAMCALGLCMNRMVGGRSCSTGAATPDSAGANADPAVRPPKREISPVSNPEAPTFKERNTTNA